MLQSSQPQDLQNEALTKQLDAIQARLAATPSQDTNCCEFYALLQALGTDDGPDRTTIGSTSLPSYQRIYVSFYKLNQQAKEITIEQKDNPATGFIFRNMSIKPGDISKALAKNPHINSPHNLPEIANICHALTTGFVHFSKNNTGESAGQLEVSISTYSQK